MKRRRSSLPLLCVLTLASIEITLGDVFAVQPSSILRPERSKADIVLQCRADNNHVTNPTYSWLKDGTFLDIGSSDRFDLAIGDLYIHSPDRRDAGSYRCRIDSDEGIAISGAATLGFQNFASPPERVPQTLQKSQGQGVEMSCGSIPHEPEFSIYYMWEMKDSFNRIPPQGEMGKYISQIDGTLYLANVQPSDEATYVCSPATIWELDGQRSTTTGNEFTLSVGETTAEYDPSFMATPKATTEVEIGGTTYIECFASGNPTPVITWTKEGSDTLPESAKVSPSGQLAFVDAGEDVEGEYTCVASSARGSISAGGRLVLKYAPRWTDAITSSDFDLASDTTLTCSAQASPVAAYEWYKNASKLDPDTYQIINGDGYSQLRLTNLQDADAGIYQCVAANNIGTIVAAANLRVRSFAPEISPSVESLTYAAFEREVTIDCPHTAAPAADVIWEKDGQVINSTRFEIYKNGSLYIHLVLEEDAGTYTCRLSNSLGNDESTGLLKVYEATTITSKFYSQHVTAGSTVTLTCTAHKDDALELTWIWRHDDELIGSNILDEHYSKNGGTLQIRNIQSQQSGRYTCCAETPVGSPCASDQIYVTAPPNPPKNIIAIATFEDSQTLTWVAGFDNHSPITSYQIQRMSAYQTEWTDSETEPKVLGNVTTCVVKSLQPYNDYYYRIRAVNGEGPGPWSETSANFKTAKGVPRKAPSRLGGGGGKVGQLIVTWEPLKPVYYGSEAREVGYIIAREVFQRDNVVIPDLTGNGTSRPTAPVYQTVWQETYIPGRLSRNYTFSVGADDVYVPYSVKICANNDLGKGKWSKVRIVHSFELAPNVAPKGLRLGPTPPRAYEADLNWDPLVSDNGRVNGYKIEIKPQTGPTQGETYFYRTDRPLTSKTVDGLTSNHVFTARVAGFNDAGDGPMSDVLEFNTAKKPPSEAPTKFELSITDKSIKAEWSSIKYSSNTDTRDMAKLSGYKVQYWINGLSSNTAMTFTTTDSKYRFDLPRDGDFNVWVKGYSVGGDGPPSVIKYVSTKSVAPPGFLECCGANTARFNSVLIMAVTLLWMLFIKLDL